MLKYCATNKLSVNLKKTNYMLILSAKKTVNINNIERKSFVKYLGVYIDEHLNWEPQIQHVHNKLAKNIGILHKIRKYVDLNVLKQLCHCLVYPYLGLGLGIMSGGSACKTRVTRVLTKQNQCIWCMFFAHRTESAKIYHALLEILELNNIYKLRIALFVHKIQNDKKGIPAIFSDALTPASEIHSHNTRYAWSQNFYRISTRTTYRQSTFQFAASKIWESVPISLKKLPYNSFKKQCKQLQISYLHKIIKKLNCNF